MEKDKNMVAVAEDLIKEPPFAVQQNYCQNKNNGLSELDFSQRNSSVVAKPECIISRSMVTEVDKEDEVVERREKKESQLHETKVSDDDVTNEMKSTIDNLRSLLREAFRQLQVERKQTDNLLSQVAELETKVLTYHHVLTEMLNFQAPIATEPNKTTQKAMNGDLALHSRREVKTKCVKKPTKSFSSAAKVVLSSVKMKQSLEKENKTAKLMKQREAERSLLSTCGDTFNSKALDIEEELDLEGRPSRFNSTIIQPNLQNGEQSNSSGAEKEEFTRKKSQKWRKTGVQSLNTDFRDTF